MAAPYPNTPILLGNHPPRNVPDAEDNSDHPTATVRRPDRIFSDNIRIELLGNLSDTLHAAWNGWDLACKYEDENLQEYYMKFIRLCDDTSRKIKRF